MIWSWSDISGLPEPPISFDQRFLPIEAGLVHGGSKFITARPRDRSTGIDGMFPTIFSFLIELGSTSDFGGNIMIIIDILLWRWQMGRSVTGRDT